MASWEAKKTTASSINLGNRFNNGDSVSAEDINAVVEAALYAQEVESFNQAVELQVQGNTETILEHTQEIEGIGRELQKIDAENPLVPNRPIYVNKNYADIRKDIAENTTNQQWLAEGDYYAFWYTDFNRPAIVGDKFGVTCSSLDGYVFNISAEVVRVVSGGRVNFKILDSNNDEKDDFVVLYKPNPTLYRTMAFTGVTAEEFTAKDENGKYTFKGYDGHHSIGVDLFSDPPSVGNNFFGTVLLLDDASDQYPTVATFTAVVTAITNNKADYSLVDATIFHKGELDQKVETLGRAVETTELLFKKPVYHLNMGIQEAVDTDIPMYSRLFNRDPKEGEIFQVVGQDDSGNAYLLTFEIKVVASPNVVSLIRYTLLSNKMYRHTFGAVSFVSSQSTEYTPKEFVTAFASSLSTVFERKANPATLALQWGKESDTVVTYVFVWSVGTDGKPLFSKQSFDVSNYTDSITEL